MKLKLLIVEDDPMLGSLISHYFSKKDWDTVIATDGNMALECFETEAFHLVLLDVMLPQKNGFEVCKRIRQSSDIPIFFITARVMEEDELHGYSLGADDYITKPFSLPILYAKAVAMINRVHGSKSFHIVKKGDIEVDLGTSQVKIHGQPCVLPKLEYDMLLYFLENSNRILSRDQFIIRLWGYDFEGNERVVDNHIKNLRKIISCSKCKISTIHKAGYRMEVLNENEETKRKND